MKQLLFLALITAAAVGTSLFNGPFAALAAYYLFAVLRPNFMWIWVLPVMLPWSFYVAAVAILTTALMGLGFYRDDDETAFAYFTPAHAAVMAFGLWAMLTYVTALDRDIAYPWLIEYSKIFTMFFVGSLVVREQRQVRILYALSLLALIYIAYEINFTYLSTGYITILRQGFGGLDNNGAGLMLAMGVPMAIFAWQGVTKWYRWCCLAAVPVLLHAVLMSYSRGAMLSLVIASPLLVMRSVRRRQAAFAVALLIMIVPILAGPEIRERFMTLRNYEEDGSANSRFDSWAAALRIAADHPITGVGIRNANLLSYQYGADYEGRTIHSQYLQIAADNGFVGLGFYLGAVAAAFLSLRRTRKHAAALDASEAAQVRALAAGVEGALVVFCVGGAFLSLELVELPYLAMLLAIQAERITRASLAQQPVHAPETNYQPSWATGSARAR